MNNTWILAQSGITEQPVSSEQTETLTTAPADPNAPATTTRPQGLFGSPLLMLGLLFVMMYFLLFRGPRKKQQQHKKMVQSLKKNDKVRTIGGIIGTIVDIKPDEITLKVDESNNTKIKVLPSAIGKSMSLDDI
ncbi:MAG: preprotein translocase subunit YajC [Planctomycetes bacterium]|nr:preprotein translocase subunit YajC [Planctomycetota bacterium]